MKAVLLLVDLQADFLGSAGLEPPVSSLVPRAARLLAGCRRLGVPVVHVRTTLEPDDDRRLPHWKEAGRPRCVRGTHGHGFPDALRPAEGETIVDKTGYNAFASGTLDETLARLGARTLVLAGVHLHACVRAAAAEGLERGLDVVVAEDATGTDDPHLAAPTRRWLAERCVRFEAVDAVLARLAGDEPPSRVHRSPRETSRILFPVESADAAQVEAAATAAREAGQAWRATEPGARAAILERFAGRLEAAAPELARRMAIEVGKPLSHGTEEARRAAGNVRDVIRRAAALPGERREPAGLVRSVPVGVVGLVSPWNNPVAIPAGKIAPALVYGNTVVWKPAPAGTGLARVVLSLLRESGVPDDAVRLLTGGGETARALAECPSVDAVTLTGGPVAGAAVGEISARRGVPLQAELSGNNAAIVWDGADLSDAAAKIARGAFGSAGQRCTANRRAIVRAEAFDAFLEAVAAAAGSLPFGDPLDEATEIGPVIHEAKRDEHARRIREAEADGAAHVVVVPHGERVEAPWTKDGAYAAPAIAGCDRPEHPLVAEETMSPLLVVQRAQDFAEAMRLLNGVRHGLAAALFGGSAAERRAFLDGARAGILKLDDSTAGVDVTLPFGGFKASGVGPPEHGEADPLFYTRLQAVYGSGEETP